MLSYTAGNESWSHESFAILDTSRVVKEEISSDVRADTVYTITVTVLTESGNLSSNTTAQYMKPTSESTIEYTPDKYENTTGESTIDYTPGESAGESPQEDTTGE